VLRALDGCKEHPKVLRRIKEAFLVFRGEGEVVVKGYNDASFQTDADDSKSQSGFVFYLNGEAVSWKSSKQDTVADSTHKLSILLLLKLQRKLFGSKILFLGWV
jgi:hypothetical protein